MLLVSLNDNLLWNRGYNYIVGKIFPRTLKGKKLTCDTYH